MTGRGIVLGLSLALGLLVALALLGNPHAPPAPPVPVTSSPAPTAAPTPEATSVTAKTRPIDPELTRTLDKFLEAVPVRLPPAPSALLKEALAAKGKSPIDYRSALEESLKRRPGARLEAAKLLAKMGAVDEKLRFQHALALSKNLDGPTTKVLLDALEPGATVDARARPHIAFALRGSRDPKVDGRLVDLYRDDADDAVRAQAAFVLQEHAKRLDPVLVERARVVARGDLTQEDPRRIQAAADVLGIPPMSDADKRSLLQTLRGDPKQARRVAALRAMASAGVPPTELEPALERIGRDPNASAELKAMARRLLTGRTAPPPR